MIAGAFILGVGVLLGVAILLLVEHLGTPKFAASPVVTQTSTPLTPKERAESSSAEGAAKPPFRAPLKSMPAYLREIEARAARMSPQHAEALMDKLRRGAY